MEIERKFLLKEGQNPFWQGFPCAHIEQAYISLNPVIRIRHIEKDAKNQYVLTVKGKGLLAHEELEMPISENEYQNLLAKKEGNSIVKTRYYQPLEDGHLLELDVFEGANRGLVLAEIEFSSEQEAEQFTIPDYLGQEVTMDQRYYNSVLSQ